MTIPTIPLVPGDDITLQITLTDSAGDALDLTGHTASVAKITWYDGAINPLTVDLTSAASGIVSITLTDTESATIPMGCVSTLTLQLASSIDEKTTYYVAHVNGVPIVSDTTLSGTAIVGIQGPAGGTILFSAGAPDNGDGNNGDINIREDTYQVYDKVSGAWVLRTLQPLAKAVAAAAADRAATLADRQLAEAARTGADDAYDDVLAALALIDNFDETLGVLLGGQAEVVAAADVVAVYVYDTTKDSDGGEWRKRCAHTSWYRETLNTATRGSRREFPQKALIVARAGSVTIYDLDSGSPEMWAKTSVAFTAIGSVYAGQGQIWVGRTAGNGVNTYDFIISRWYLRNTFYKYTYIVGSFTGSLSTPTFEASGKIVNANVNAVAMTVLPGAPIDPVRGLPNPTIAVATDGGVSVINHEGTVTNSAVTGSISKIGFRDNGDLWYSSTTNLYVAMPSVYLTASFAAAQTITPSSVPAKLANNVAALAAGKASGSSSGLTLHLSDMKQAASAVAHVTDTCNTGFMVGDCKLALAESTADVTSLVGGTVTDRSVAGNNATVNGIITRSAVASGTELVAFSGFSAADYLEVPDDADFDFGTGDFCMMGWATNPNVGQRTFISRMVDGDAGFNLQINAGSQLQLVLRQGASLSVISSALVSQSSSFSFFVGLRRAGVCEVWVDGRPPLSAPSTLNITPSGLAGLRVGLNSDGAFPAASMALWRISATAPTPEQIRAIYEAERGMFQANAKCLLPAASVSALSHDPDTGILHAATTGGLAKLRGCEVIEKDTTVYTGIHANDGFIATRDTGSADIYVPTNLPIRALLGHNGGPALYDRKKAVHKGYTSSATPTVLSRLPLREGEEATFVLRTLAVQRADGTQVASYEHIGTARRTWGGSVALVGSVTERIIQEVTGTMACAVTASGNYLIVTDTGVASTDIEWTHSWELVTND